MEQLDEYNYGARAYSIRAPAAIADPRALDVLVTAAATDFAPVRRAAAKGLGTLHWSLLDADQRSSAQAKARDAAQCLQDPDWSILLCRCGGLASAFHDARSERAIQAQFEQMARTDPDTAVRELVWRNNCFIYKNRSIRCQYHYLKLHQPLRTSASKVTKYRREPRIYRMRDVTSDTEINDLIWATTGKSSANI